MNTPTKGASQRNSAPDEVAGSPHITRAAVISEQDIMSAAERLAQENNTLVCSELNKIASLSSCTLSPSITAHVLGMLDTIVEGCVVGEPMTIQMLSPPSEVEVNIPRSPLPKTPARLSSSATSMRSPLATSLSGSQGAALASPLQRGSDALYDAMHSPLFSPSASPARQSASADSLTITESIEAEFSGGIYEETEELKKSHNAMSFLTSSQHLVATDERADVVLEDAALLELKEDVDYSHHYAKVELNLTDDQLSQLTADAAEIPDLRLKYHIRRPSEQEIVRSCRFCFDNSRCGKLKLHRSSAPDFCKTCTDRTQFELNCINRLSQVFPKGISLFSVVDSELLTSDLESTYLRLMADIVTIYEVPDASFLYKCAATMAGYSDSAFRKEVVQPSLSHYKQAMGIQSGGPVTEPGVRSQRDKKQGVMLVMAELICEGIFGVPGFLAFSLFARIRSEYRHMHPCYLDNIDKFPVPETIRSQILLDAPAENNTYTKLTNYKFLKQSEHFNIYSVTLDQIRAFYSENIMGRSTNTRLFNCLKLGKAHAVVEDDLMAFMAGVCRYHPALEFLRATPEFQVQYSITVVTRVFYLLDRTFKQHITQHDLTINKFINTLWLLQREPDINRVLKYFSYEHFYVIFCKFWELDTDHDQLISAQDLYRYGIHTCPFPYICKCGKTDGTCMCNRVYNPKVVDRIFAEIPRPFRSNVPGKMGYKDFIPFILAEEDKDSDPALDYFFALMDVDGDGYISTDDIMHFCPDMEAMYHCHKRDTNRQKDIMCQMVDMAKHTQHCVGEGFYHQDQRISKRDVRRCKTQGNLFNVFFNFTKAVQFECKDPYTIRYSPHMFEKTTWERFARIIYDSLEGMEEAAQEVYEEPEPLGDDLAADTIILDADALDV